MLKGTSNFLSVNERNFILESLKEKQRIDGRNLYDFRTLKISFPTLDRGLVEIQLGATRIICRVSCEIVEPFPDRPNEGFFNFTIEFSPMADPSFEVGRPSEVAIELGRIIERGLRESKAIDTEALCIISGEKVWFVRCDIHIVDNGGNLLDCASIAAITALCNFRRPATTISGRQLTVHSLEEHEPVALNIHHIPVCVTFAFFNNGDILVVDPNLKEEQCMDGRMTFTLNSHREICAVQKAGGIPLSVGTILQCARIAAVKVEEITEIIQESLKQYSTPMQTEKKGKKK